MTQTKIAFIGAGHMGSSLMGGLIQSGHSKQCILASNKNEKQCENLKQKFHIEVTTDNASIAKQADILVLCVKPDLIKTVALELKTIIAEKNPLIISIAAGISTTRIEEYLGLPHAAIVRCMPNMPALVGASASALFANAHVLAHQKTLAESILRAVGLTVWLQNEAQMDVATALSGSGPAYFFLVMECLSKAAVDLGLDSKTAHILTLQTALGAAKMALESEHDVMQLRRHVTSPKGTTEAAIHTLLEHDIAEIFKKAVTAATNRAKELAGNA